MVNWDDANEKQLLLSIIHVLQPPPSSITWSIVAKAISEDCTEEACKQKLKKLRAAAKDKFGEPPAATNEDGTPKTPASKRAGRKAAAKGEGGSKSAGKRKASKGAEEEEEEEVGVEEETPAKKAKKSEVKVEEDAEGTAEGKQQEANGKA